MLKINSIAKRAALACAALAIGACTALPPSSPTTHDEIRDAARDVAQSAGKIPRFYEGTITKIEVRTREEIYKAKDSGWSTLAGTNTKSAGAGLGLMVGLDLLSALENSARKNERYRVATFEDSATGEEQALVLANRAGNVPEFSVGDHLFAIRAHNARMSFFNLTDKPELIPVIEEGRALGRANKAKREERRSDSIQQP